MAHAQRDGRAMAAPAGYVRQGAPDVADVVGMDEGEAIGAGERLGVVAQDTGERRTHVPQDAVGAHDHDDIRRPAHRVLALVRRWRRRAGVRDSSRSGPCIHALIP